MINNSNHPARRTASTTSCTTPTYPHHEHTHTTRVWYLRVCGVRVNRTCATTQLTRAIVFLVLTYDNILVRVACALRVRSYYLPLTNDVDVATSRLSVRKYIYGCAVHALAGCCMKDTAMCGMQACSVQHEDG